MMQVICEIWIDSAREQVWKTIADIKSCGDVIASIDNIEILEHPTDQMQGLKWRETRIMFGKEATETMWITDAKENEYYATRAESHGSVYISRLSLTGEGDRTKLTMLFKGLPVTMIAKVMSFLMAPMIKGSLKKTIGKDLENIKSHIEKEL